MSGVPHALFRPEFPRSNGYDPDWIMDNQMGPNPLWLGEWLSEALGIKEGMRVLDLGCGKAMTSIFWAREYNVQVWAADLWISQDENWQRINAAGLTDRVYPMRVEAHSLPFAQEFFDVIVSVDAYQYFGTDELYLAYLSRFLRPKGQIGIVVPGLMQPFEVEIPSHLMQKQSNGHRFWEDDCISFKTAAWWRELWERSNRVEVSLVDTQKDGWRYWRDFEIDLVKTGKNIFPSDDEVLHADQGRYLGFVRAVGMRRENACGLNLYDPNVIATLDNGEG